MTEIADFQQHMKRKEAELTMEEETIRREQQEMRQQELLPTTVPISQPALSSYEKVGDMLTPDDAVAMLEELLEAQYESYNLGLKLKLPVDVVDSIHERYELPSQRPQRLLRILIHFLRQTEPRPTWRVVVDALRSPLVSLHALAKKVEAAHIPDPSATRGILLSGKTMTDDGDRKDTAEASKPGPDTVNEASHWTLLNELNEVSPKWRILGLGLHLSHDTLSDIGWPSEDDLNKLSKVILEWLRQSTPPPTWNYLLHVLRSPVMGEMVLAACIEKKYSADISPVPSEKQEGKTIPETDDEDEGELKSVSVSGTVLNKASHWTLLNELNQMSPKWRILGLGLHLSHDKLNDIGWPSSEDDLNKLSKVIVEWLQQSTPPPTLNYLLHVLRSPVMGEMLLAARIEKKYSANISSVPSEKQIEALDALAEGTVIVTNEEQHFVWEGYGLRLHIPSDALPEGYSQFELKMKVALAKEFQSPGEDGGPVSAVYSFSHDLGDKELCQPVTVEMQHCAAASAVKDLCIVRADENSDVFDIIPGGVFDQRDGYATIKLRSFCKLCVYLHWFLASLFSTLVPCAKLYYTNIERNSFRFYLYLIPWLDALLEMIDGKVRSEHAPDSVDSIPISPIAFQESTQSVSLEIPRDPVCGGWKMTLANPHEKHPSDIVRVDNVTPFQVDVTWVGSGSKTLLEHDIIVGGVHCVTVKSPIYSLYCSDFLIAEDCMSASATPQQAQPPATISLPSAVAIAADIGPITLTGKLDINKDVLTVRNKLKNLKDNQMGDLFRELGLSDATVLNKSDDYAENLIRAWILGGDDVLKSEKYTGGATWENLKRALVELGHRGIAKSI